MKTCVPSILAFGGALIAWSTYSSSSSACLDDGCVDTVRVFPNPNEGVPGNLVYFKILVDDPGPLMLRTSEGEPIAASIRTLNGDLVFAPDEAIPEFTSVVLEFNARCNGPPDVLQQFNFFTIGPQSFDPGPSALRVVERGMTYGGNEEAVFVRLAVDTGLSVHLKTNTITLDGAPLSPLAMPSLLANESGLTLEVQSGCLPLQERAAMDSCGGTYSVPPGLHILRIDTTVVGATTQPEPVVMEVETACPPEPEAPSEAALGEAAISDEPATVDEPAIIDGPAGSGASSACTVAPAESPPTGAAPLGVALLSLSMLVHRRGRRRAHAHH